MKSPMKILVTWTKSGIPAEASIIDAACAGMVSRKDEAYDQFVSGISSKRAREFLLKMIELGHDSVLEHITFQFWVSISRVASHQLVRHRMASYTQKSLRKERDLQPDDFVVPTEIKPEDLEEWIADIRHTIQTYQKWLDKGYPVDIARRKLTQEIRTDLVMTINARSLRNFFRLRAEYDADFEIRELANQMVDLVKDAGLDYLFKDVLP